MTTDEKNKRLAELLGWTKHRLGARGELYATPPDGTWGKQITIPDYCTDLSAAHEVVMGLPEMQRQHFGMQIWKLVCSDNGTRPIRNRRPYVWIGVSEVLAAGPELWVDALILTLEAQ